ncbi:MAG: hypothetical protein GXO79_01665 [Chlorobi bacterium]|nr:hypothetical protein [Chlorobiota bacterium]
MTLTAIIVLIILGILLLLVEFLVIPGITIAGIGGILLIGTGIYFGYDSYGTTYGHIIMLCTLVVLVIIIAFSLRSGTWNKIMLKAKIDGKMNVIKEQDLSIGEIGKSITRLAPIGKALFKDIEYEAKTNGEFVDQNSEIEIIKILSNQIIVKLKSN